MKGWVALFVGAFISLGWGSAGARAVEPVATPGPLYQQVTNEFVSMKRTLYQYFTRVDTNAGSYCFDCVGLVSHALRSATPQAWQSVVKGTKLAPHRIPNPLMYRAFLAELAVRPQPGWVAVTNAADLRPGDVVVWEQKTTNATGHAVIIGGFPTRDADGSFVVKVYDSTSSPHSEDSRPTDPRAEVLVSNGRPSGLGHGVMVFVAGESGGPMTGLRWSLKAKTVTVPIAAGRPVY
jgi:hypothetical protein